MRVLGFGVTGLGSGFRFQEVRVQETGFRGEDSGLRVQG